MANTPESASCVIPETDGKCGEGPTDVVKDDEGQREPAGEVRGSV